MFSNEQLVTNYSTIFSLQSITTDFQNRFYVRVQNQNVCSMKRGFINSFLTIYLDSSEFCHFSSIQLTLPIYQANKRNNL